MNKQFLIYRFFFYRINFTQRSIRDLESPRCRPGPQHVIC